MFTVILLTEWNLEGIIINTVSAVFQVVCYFVNTHIVSLFYTLQYNFV